VDTAVMSLFPAGKLARAAPGDVPDIPGMASRELSKHYQINNIVGFILVLGTPTGVMFEVAGANLTHFRGSLRPRPPAVNGRAALALPARTSMRYRNSLLPTLKEAPADAT